MRLDRMPRLVQRCRHPCWCLDRGWANKLHQWQSEEGAKKEQQMRRQGETDNEWSGYLPGLALPCLALPCAAGGWLITLNCNLYAPSVSRSSSSNSGRRSWSWIRDGSLDAAGVAFPLKFHWNVNRSQFSCFSPANCLLSRKIFS